MVELNQAAVLIPLDPVNRVLLQRKDLGYPWNPGQWGFFGGKIEDGEDPHGRETVVREIAEETGLVLENLVFFKKHPYHDTSPLNGRQREGHLYVFSCKFDGDLSRIKLREGAGFSMYEESEIWNLHMVYHNKDVLLEFYRNMHRK